MNKKYKYIVCLSGWFGIIDTNVIIVNGNGKMDVAEYFPSNKWGRFCHFWNSSRANIARNRDYTHVSQNKWQMSSHSTPGCDEIFEGKYLFVLCDWNVLSLIGSLRLYMHRLEYKVKIVRVFNRNANYTFTRIYVLLRDMRVWPHNCGPHYKIAEWMNS